MATDQARGNDFESFVQSRQDSLLRTAFLLVGDAANAEDITQNALAKLYLAWGRLGQIDHPDAYVRRVLVNEANTLWRKPWKRREFTVAEMPDVEATTSPTHSAEVWQWINTLPSGQRAVVVLRYYEGLSEAEIAEVLQLSTGTVKSQASRALAALRTRIPDGLEVGDLA